MNATLKLSVNQVSTAILLLEEDERKELEQRLPALLALKPEALEDYSWLYLAESALEFWNDPAEDIYDDLIPMPINGG